MFQPICLLICLVFSKNSFKSTPIIHLEIKSVTVYHSHQLKSPWLTRNDNDTKLPKSKEIKINSRIQTIISIIL